MATVNNLLVSPGVLVGSLHGKMVHGCSQTGFSTLPFGLTATLTWGSPPPAALKGG